MTHRFFGYGSLVNRRTHDYPNAAPLRIRGWKRAWAHTPLRPVAFLTAIPAPGAEINGLAADVPDGDWSALDAREAAYQRAHTPEGAQIYHIPDGHHGPATDTHPILRSYLDVVVQGYLREFGPSGVTLFFNTTEGWQAPIRDDRAAPIYSRAQPMSAEETALVDQHLAAVRAKQD